MTTNLTEQEQQRLHWLAEQQGRARCALLDGLPLVVVPADADREDQAWAVQRAELYRGRVVHPAPAAGTVGEAVGTVDLLNQIIAEALNGGASDIHLEPSTKGLAIKLRLDGILVFRQLVADLVLAEKLLSRIKVLAELDIAERRIPQDGRFQLQHAGRVIDCRVSIMPSELGEGAVLRLLDRERWKASGGNLTLESLGLSEAARGLVRDAAQRPHGMLLVTGPTGSGKTTTLYATIEESLSGVEKVITIEDPVEYLIDGTLQIPVNEKKGLTFSRGLRSILRHDPDKIMVGEIRDKETAEISIQAALTGHLVFTTVHANSAFDVLARFQHMGIDAYSLVSALHTIMAQRLLRQVCTACAEPMTPASVLATYPQLAAHPELMTSAWRQASGCDHCHGTGYSGRRAVAECLVLDDELKLAILAETAPTTLAVMARQKGMVTLQDEALTLAAAGVTTLQEVTRVLGSA